MYIQNQKFQRSMYFLIFNLNLWTIIQFVNGSSLRTKMWFAEIATGTTLIQWILCIYIYHPVLCGLHLKQKQCNQGEYNHQGSIQLSICPLQNYQKKNISINSLHLFHLLVKFIKLSIKTRMYFNIFHLKIQNL